MSRPVQGKNERAPSWRVVTSPFVFVGFALVVVGALIANVMMRSNSDAIESEVTADNAAEPSTPSPEQASKLAALTDTWQALEEPDMDQVLAHSDEEMVQLLDRVCQLAAESGTRETFDARLRVAGAESPTDGMTGDHMHEIGDGALRVWCEEPYFSTAASAAS